MKDLFFLPDGIYTLSHSVGPLTTLGEQYLAEKYLTPLKQTGGDAWPDWLGFMDEFTDALAGFLGGRSEDYCPQVNLSAGLTKFLTALPDPDQRNKVLMHAHAFPSMGFVIQALSARGYALELIPENRSAIDPQVWADALDDKTADLFITHAYSNTGMQSPVAKLTQLARGNDCLALVDIAQSAGIIPIDIPSWDADAVFGSSVKWLCGGPGAGYMWINPDRSADLVPQDVGWFSHENPFEFDIRNFKPAPAAKRFLGGTPSVAPYAMALGGIRTLAKIGIDAVRAHNLELMRQLNPDIEDHRNGGTLCLDFGDRVDAIAATLQDIGCRFDQRGTSLRLSFHIYNTGDEADKIAEIVNQT